VVGAALPATEASKSRRKELRADQNQRRICAGATDQRTALRFVDPRHLESDVKHIPLSLALAIAAIGGPAWAAQQDPHQGHHPETAKPATAPPAAPATAANPMSGKASTDVTRMDTQMKMMREMHIKMMAAKTPEERSALMSEHMKVMRDGMAMMKGMSSGGMGEMKCDLAANHRMMEKRMEMMEAMMQMMVDRLPAPPGK